MNSQIVDINESSKIDKHSESTSLQGKNDDSFGELRSMDNGIFISEKAKLKVINLMKDAGLANDESYFLRVGVVGGGCSGLSYKMDFDNEVKPMDQAFEDKGIKIVTDLKSFLYLVNTELEFSDGLNGKGFYFNNPNASRSCGCGESFAV